MTMACREGAIILKPDTALPGPLMLPERPATDEVQHQIAPISIRRES